jgi:recombination protein RecR
MALTPKLQALIESLRRLPGVGPKTAQRMALHLLERDRDAALMISEALATAARDIGECQQCHSLSEAQVCDICQHPGRDRTTLCVLESPIDLMAIEQTGGFSGLYFVLGGHLSPIDGIGPEELGIDQLLERLYQGEVQELVLATNPTVEGEATAHYIAEQLRDLDIKVSRIAHGVPVGGELEFVDGGTLAHALAGRRQMERGH